VRLARRGAGGDAARGLRERLLPSHRGVPARRLPRPRGRPRRRRLPRPRDRVPARVPAPALLAPLRRGPGRRVPRVGRGRRRVLPRALALRGGPRRARVGAGGRLRRGRRRAAHARRARGHAAGRPRRSARLRPPRRSSRSAGRRPPAPRRRPQRPLPLEGLVPEPTRLCVCDGDAVRYRRLDAEDADLLERAREGTTFGSLDISPLLWPRRPPHLAATHLSRFLDLFSKGTELSV
jgi:hypothetical protein